MKPIYVLIICFCLSIMLQAQVSKTVNITTAGSLKTMITLEDLQTITDLILTGTIDARDFKTMRDDMPFLAEVDLSKVTIAAYSGYAGTHPEQNEFSSNEIPSMAFYNPNNGKGKTTLTTIILPSSTIVIGDVAFSGCSGLTTLSIPSSVITIGRCSFADCTGLTSIYCYGYTPPNFTSYGDGGYGCQSPFYHVNTDSCIVYVPYGTKVLYNSPDIGHWQGFKDIVEMHGYIFSINSINLEAKDRTATANISSDVTWTVNADQSWVTLHPTSGTGNQTLIFSVEPNTSSVLRTSTITMSADGIPPLSINLMQKGILKTLINSAGGLLSALTVEELKGITDLLLTGTIDARDFKTMRDTMPFLTNVDLTEATITAFSGVGGTLNGGHSYPANEVPDEAFYGCSRLESVLLPSNITSIAADVFNNCQSMNSVNIPASVSSIGSYAFFSCTKLTAITIPPAVTSIEQSTFDGCTGLISVTLPENLNKIGDNAFVQCLKLKSITLPSSVRLIGSCAFGSCENIKTITIPSAVTSIEQFTFIGCTSLNSITLPENLNKIGFSAFAYCDSLTSIHLPSSITDIGDLAFFLCSGLTSVSIPSSMTKIGNGVFMYCFGLTSVAIPSSISSIDKEAFRCCIGLTSITIPASVTSIGEQAFNDCIGLTSVSIPSSVTLIGNHSFFGCRGLKTIYSYSPIPIDLNSVANVFLDVDKNSCILYVPAGSKDLYADANQWKDFNNIVEMTTGMDDLLQNTSHFTCYPNPFTHEITIEIQNPKHIKLTVDIYNLAGQKVKTLAVGNTSEALNLVWDGTNEKGQLVLPAIYICKMNEQTRQLVYAGNK